MDRQAIFDRVLHHLRKQGKQAMLENGANCAYRGKDGLKCAIGCLIPDEAYDVKWENGGVTSLAKEKAFRQAIGLARPSHARGDIRFLCHLQGLHDDPLNWNPVGRSPVGFNADGEITAKNIAIENGLSYSPRPALL